MDNYSGFIGKILDGRYRILELVGVGGMAFVLKAEDLVMNRLVAIKILNDQYNGDEQAEKRFINESKAVAMLSNKNVVNVYDVAIYPDIKYIVMEYLDGITLRAYMDAKKVLPWKEACVYTLQILRGLEHAHSKNVIHRDIKPQNIILLRNGEVKVTDFGIAKTPDMAGVAADDKAIGTVYYISPEQAGGKETNFASDIYSVGVMLYEMVTGVLPFVADSAVTVAMMQINETPKSPRSVNGDVPECVSQIIMKAMEKLPENRFTDAHSMLKAVDYAIKHPEVVFCDGITGMALAGADEEPAEKSAASEGDGDFFDDEAAKDKENGENEEAATEEEKAPKIDINSINTGDISEYVVNVADESKAPEKKKHNVMSKERRKARKSARKDKPSHSLFPVVSGVFFAFLIVSQAVAGYLLIKWLPKLFEVKEKDAFYVDDFYGEEYTTALKQRLEENGYLVGTPKEVYKPGLGYNVIVDQDPDSGNTITADGHVRITFTVNMYPDELTVPDVSFMTETEAERTLRQYNLYANTKYITDMYANDKQVVSTSPSIGSHIEPGSTVTVYVNSIEEVTVAKTTPYVVGITLDEAREALRAAFYNTIVVYQNSDMPDGQVIAQDVPAYTKDLAPWTDVTITVSRHVEMVTAESYFGMTLERATQKILSAGMKVGAVTYRKSVYAVGTVIEQSIPAGTKVENGTTVNLVICGEGEDVASAVPSVLGLTEAAAVAKLENAGFAPEVVYKPAEGSIGIVLNQSLSEGSTGYKVGTKITVTVSVAADSVLVKDCTGYTVAQVLKYIDESGLKLGNVVFTTETEEPKTENTVIMQTVVPGTYVNKNSSVGFTFYGIARNASAVPSVVRMTEAAAVKALYDAWYSVTVVYEVAHDTDGVVLRQSIEANTEGKPIGTVITLTVCIAQKNVIMPKLVGKTFDQALEIIYANDLALGSVSYEQSDLPDGQVTKQSVAEGDEIAFGTSIDLVISENA